MRNEFTRFLLVTSAATAVLVYGLTDADATAFDLAYGNVPATVNTFMVADKADLLDARLTTKDLLAVYNAAMKATDQKTLAKFADKTSAAERTFAVLNDVAIDYPTDFIAGLGGNSSPPSAPVAASEPTMVEPAAKPASDGKRGNGFKDRDAQAKIFPCRAGTKQAALVDALAKGATMDELLIACSGNGKSKSWTETSVKSALYWDINSQKGYGVKAVANASGVLVYSLTYPAGMSAPVPHTPSKSKKA